MFNAISARGWYLYGALALAALGGCEKQVVAPSKQVERTQTNQVTEPAASAKPSRGAPTEAELSQAEQGAALVRGLNIVTRTFETLPDHSPSGLHCSSCHLEGGTKALAGPWLGIAAKYPVYRARSGKVDTLEERINGCFERSMNGRALDPNGPDMAAIVSYIHYISRDVPAGETPGRGFAKLTRPAALDRERGQALYGQKCSACHAPNGAGLSPGDVYAFPPLAGARAFNIGAGMARLNTAAAFIQANMPLGQGGTLSAQDAYDLADYVIHLERPEFARKAEDWPRGDKPEDARY